MKNPSMLYITTQEPVIILTERIAKRKNVLPLHFAPMDWED
jgi:hypothetical protein